MANPQIWEAGIVISHAGIVSLGMSMSGCRLAHHLGLDWNNYWMDYHEIWCKYHGGQMSRSTPVGHSFHLSSEISPHLFDGLAQNLVQTFMVPGQSILMNPLNLPLAPPCRWLFEWNIWTSIGLIAMKFHTAIHVTLRMCNNFSSSAVIRTKFLFVRCFGLLSEPCMWSVAVVLLLEKRLKQSVSYQNSCWLFCRLAIH